MVIFRYMHCRKLTKNCFKDNKQDKVTEKNRITGCFDQLLLRIFLLRNENGIISLSV